MSVFKKSGSILLSTALAASVVLVTAAPASANTCKGAPKIVWQGALTGPYAQTGKGIYKGYQFAIDKYNATNPRQKLKYHSIDTQASGAQSPALATQLANDPCVIGVVGGMYSGETAAALPIYKAAGITVISPSATRVDLPQIGGDIFHRVIANDDVQGPAMAKLALQKRGAKVFVVDDQTAYGLGLAQIIRKRISKAQLVGNDAVTEGTTNFSSVVTKVGRSGANAVVYAGYYPEAAKFIRQLRDNPRTKNVMFISGDGTLDDEFVKLAKPKYVEGALLTTGGLDMNAASPALAAEFRKKYGKPLLYSTEGYNATTFFLEGLKRGNNTRAKMLKFVNTSSVRGMGYTMKFSRSGELGTKQMFAWTYKKGKPVGVGRI